MLAITSIEGSLHIRREREALTNRFTNLAPPNPEPRIKVNLPLRNWIEGLMCKFWASGIQGIVADREGDLQKNDNP